MEIRFGTKIYLGGFEFFLNKALACITKFFDLPHSLLCDDFCDTLSDP